MNDSVSSPQAGRANSRRVFKRDNLLQGTRILLLENDAINQQMAVDILGIAGCIVTVASDGAEALAKIFGMDPNTGFQAVRLMTPTSIGP